MGLKASYSALESPAVSKGFVDLRSVPSAAEMEDMTPGTAGWREYQVKKDKKEGKFLKLWFLSETQENLKL